MCSTSTKNLVIRLHSMKQPRKELAILQGILTSGIIIIEDVEESKIAPEGNLLQMDWIIDNLKINTTIVSRIKNN